jgi:hypothetical protein
MVPARRAKLVTTASNKSIPSSRAYSSLLAAYYVPSIARSGGRTHCRRRRRRRRQRRRLYLGQGHREQSRYNQLCRSIWSSIVLPGETFLINIFLAMYLGGWGCNAIIFSLTNYNIKSGEHLATVCAHALDEMLS